MYTRRRRCSARINGFETKYGPIFTAIGFLSFSMLEALGFSDAKNTQCLGNGYVGAQCSIEYGI
jgi:hypothetical protein